MSVIQLCMFIMNINKQAVIIDYGKFYCWQYLSIFYRQLVFTYTIFIKGKRAQGYKTQTGNDIKVFQKQESWKRLHHPFYIVCSLWYITITNMCKWDWAKTESPSCKQFEVKGTIAFIVSDEKKVSSMVKAGENMIRCKITLADAWKTERMEKRLEQKISFPFYIVCKGSKEKTLVSSQRVLLRGRPAWERRVDP